MENDSLNTDPLDTCLKVRSQIQTVGICDIVLTQDKEKDLMALYKVSDKDIIDFDRFFELSQVLVHESENRKQDLEDLEYGIVTAY